MTTNVLVVVPETVPGGLATVLDADTGLHVVGTITSTSVNGLLRAVRDLGPDVVVLDPAVAAGSGLRQVELLMAQAPIPILVVADPPPTGPTDASRDEERFLAAGAVAVVPREPSARLCSQTRIVAGVAVVGRRSASQRQARADRLAEVDAEAHAGTGTGAAGPAITGPTPGARRRAPAPASGRPTASASDAATGSTRSTGSTGSSRSTAPGDRRSAHDGPTVVALGASTGGPAAVAAILTDLGAVDAAVLVIQHLHPDFVDGFVGWMRRVAAMPVQLAEDGRAPRPGVVHVAPGGLHLVMGPDGLLHLDREPETLHRPSVDVTFASLARHSTGPVVAVLLTGIGDDGARGLGEIRAAGGATFAQDRETSAVYGMPAAASRIGASQADLPLPAIAAAIRNAVTTGRAS